MPQLTPELAIEACERDVVVFVDASIDDVQVAVRRVDAATSIPGALTHYADPAILLAMVSSVGTPPERAYLVSVPASDFGLGFELTRSTEAAVAEAVEVVTTLVSR